jgi:hypothetical protein
MKNLPVLFLLLATPTQANPLALICTGKTFQKGENWNIVPGAAVFDLDKLTFKHPCSALSMRAVRLPPPRGGALVKGVDPYISRLAVARPNRAIMRMISEHG